MIDNILMLVQQYKEMGAYQKAIEELKKGYNHYPDQIILLEELYIIYSGRKAWGLAKDVVDKLIKLEPENGDYYLRLGKIYIKIGYEKADSIKFIGDRAPIEEAFQKGLIYKHHLPLDLIIERIKSHIFPNTSNIDTQFSYLGGQNSLGVLIHSQQGNRYVTKISRDNVGSRREKLFYEIVQPSFEELKNITPHWLGSYTLDEINYLTLAEIKNVPSAQLFEKIINTSVLLSSIYQSGMVQNFENNDYTFKFRNSGLCIIEFFTKIHEKEYNQQLIEYMQESVVKEKDYSEECLFVIREIKKYILTNELYTLIEPEQQYRLIHADLVPENVLSEENNIYAIFIDWSFFSVGPRFLDVARFSMQAFIEFSEIEEVYLSNKISEVNLSNIEKIFFCYAFIFIHFAELPNNKKYDYVLNQCVIPALNYVRNNLSLVI